MNTKWINRKTLGLLAVVLLILALPFAIAQVMRQQETRSGATVDVGASFDPVKSSKPVGEEFEVKIKVNGGSNNVSYVKMSLNFDENTLEAVSFAPSGNYTALTETVISQTGTVDIELVDISTQAPSGEVEIGALTLKGKAQGTGSLAVTGAEMYATGVNGELNLTPTTPGEYLITDSSTSNEPTATPTNAPTATTAPTATNAPTATTAPTATAVPTATHAPTATPIPGDTTININVVLPGIGNGTANLGLNATPIHPQRAATLNLFDSTNTNVLTVDGTMTYTPSSSAYHGEFALGTSFPTGVYTAKIKLNSTLSKSLDGAMQINNGVANASIVWTGNPSTLISGDLNDDNTLGVIDWTFMIACVKSETACTDSIRSLADLNDNGKVDEIDVQILQRGFAIRDGD